MSADAAGESTSADPSSQGEPDLVRRGEQIERLLDELEALSGPTIWPRIEELVHALVELYGRGLARLLAHARATVSDGAALGARITNDEFLAGLLTLHDLHPQSARQRIESALARVERELAQIPAKLELVDVAPKLATVRLVDVRDALAAKSLAQVVQRALLQAAPELERVEITGLAPAPVLDQQQQLVSVERLRQSSRS